MLPSSTLFACPGLAYVATAAIALCVGSFLNVVIHRLPRMLERQWQAQCGELLGIADTAKADGEPYNLMTPASHCPRCRQLIAAWHNIPVLSYLFRAGCCAHCGVRIPIRYLLVEALTGALSVIIVWYFGFGIEAGFALVLTWALVALAFIDAEHQILPDIIVLPVLWLGLFANLDAHFTSLQSAVIGAAAGYLILWLVFQLFRLVTGKEGMGYGDFKLLAMLGAWLGWPQLPLVILLSALVGTVMGLFLILVRGRDRAQPLPFGPYLAAAGWIALLWGDSLLGAYQRFAGLA